MRELLQWRARAEPIVEQLRDRDLVAQAVAEHVRGEVHGRFSRREQAIAGAAVLVGILDTVHVWFR